MAVTGVDDDMITVTGVDDDVITVTVVVKYELMSVRVLVG